MKPTMQPRVTLGLRRIRRASAAHGRGADHGAVSGLVIGLVCVLLGSGAAVAAVSAVLTATGPDDSGAVLNGPKQPVSPTEIIRYGG